MQDPLPPFPPPFGMPHGLSLSTDDLLLAYLAGATTGSSPDAHIEGVLLMGSDHYVAARLDVAMIVRADVPDVAVPVHDALRRALQADGFYRAAEESVLAGALASELAVPRGFEWELWARDPEQVRLDLARRAAGDLPTIW